jgi:hypothetical protein
MRHKRKLCDQSLPPPSSMVGGARIFCVAALLALSPVLSAAVKAQTASQTSNDVQTDTNVDVVASPQSGSQASSGGNIFDFSSSSQGRNTPPAPNLPSFAGGPCTGPGAGVTASGPGFALGAGKSFEDEACQRRNWVQTLIGVSQHMPEVEANELKRVAIAIMMQDQYVGPAFEALGYDTSRPGVAQPRPRVAGVNAAQQQRRSAVAEAPRQQPARASMAGNCVAVVPANASSQFRRLVSARGCQIQTR